VHRVATTRVLTLSTARPQLPGLRNWSSGASMVARGAISVWPIFDTTSDKLLLNQSLAITVRA